MLSVKTLAELMLSFGSMSNKKLQKICYYAYCWYLVLYGRQLAPLEFEAWVHGPVSRELYNNYKNYGWSDIPQYFGVVMVAPEICDFAEDIWDRYGHFSADELETMTHKETPWIKAREGYKYYEPSDVLLDDRDIIEFYSKYYETH